MQKKLKVLVIPAWYPSKANSLAGNFFAEQCILLNKKAEISIAHINLVSILSPKSIFNVLFKNKAVITTENNIQVYRKNCPSFEFLSDKLAMSVYSKYCNKAIKALHKQTLPDVIHAQVTYPCGAAATSLKNKYNIPFVVSEHYSQFNILYNSKKQPSINKTLANANYVTAVSSMVKGWINSTGREQCEIVPNFIDLDKFPLSDSVYKKGELKLIHVSNFAKIKQIDLIIKALAQIKKNSDIKVTCTFVGDGLEKLECVELARQCGITDRCNFVGSIENAVVNDYLAKADAGIITSKTETFSIIGVETLAVGRPIIVTPCGGPMDYADSLNAVVTAGFSVDDIVNAIIKLHDNYESFNLENIRNNLKGKYDSGTVVEKFIEIYNKVG